MSGGSFARGRTLGSAGRGTPPPPPPAAVVVSPRTVRAVVRQTRRRPHFNPVFLEVLLSDDRKRFFPAEEILRAAGIRPGMMVIDLGCGPGYFTMPARRLAGDEGRVWAVDVQQIMVDHVHNRCQIGRIRGVRCVLSAEQVVPLDDAMADFVLIAWVLNEADDAGSLIAEARRLLKPGGTIAVLEWHKQAKEVAIPVERRVGVDDLAKLAKASRLHMLPATDLSPDAYIARLRVELPVIEAEEGDEAENGSR